MSEIILTAEDEFTVHGRGLVVTGWQKGVKAELKVGDMVEILTPGGKLIKTQINGIEYFRFHYCFGESDRRNLAFAFRDLKKGVVPRGSTIKLLNQT